MNRFTKLQPAMLLAFAVLIAGCQKQMQPQEAVIRAVIDQEQAEAMRQSEMYTAQLEMAAAQMDQSQRQLDRSDRQLERMETSLRRNEDYNRRMEALLARWEKQADRYDRLLERWEKEGRGPRAGAPGSTN